MRVDATTNPAAALDEAIQRSARFGWRVVRRKGRAAELTDATGSQRLYLEVDAAGVVHDQQTIGSAMRPSAPPKLPFRRLALYSLLFVFGVSVGTASAVYATKIGPLRASQGAPVVPLTAAVVAQALESGSASAPLANFRRLSVATTGDSVILAVEPPLGSDTDAVAVASSDAIVAAQTLFHAYPQVTIVTVAVFAHAGTNGVTRLLTKLSLSTATAAQLDFTGLTERDGLTGIALYCRADSYSIDANLYSQLLGLHATGCLSAASR